MPGPISDSYDAEWGTRNNAEAIIEELDAVYRLISDILGNRPPIYILELIDADLPNRTVGHLTEKEWRLIRFALERAKDSI